jgi:DNA-binding NarL/FixJ family response regulator
MEVCVRTVEAHRARLVKKINVSSLRELLHIAIAVAAAELEESRSQSYQEAAQLGYVTR